MVKRVSFFLTIFTVCIFAENIAEVKPIAAEAAPAAETVQAEQVAAEAAPAAETVQAEQVAAEAAPAAETVEAAPAVQAPAATTAPVATGSAKEAIIEDPLEFAIVSAVFLATVLLITLTGN
jgi:hypothetical protein